MAAGAAGGELRLASSEATREELWRVQEGTVDAIPVPMKMRLADPTEWLRLKLDVTNVATKLRGPGFMRSKEAVGEHGMLVLVRRMQSLQQTTLGYVFERVSDYMYRKYDMDVRGSDLTVRLPRQVPLQHRYTLADLYFICCALEQDMFAFLDDGFEYLELEVTTIQPLNPLGPNGEEGMTCRTATASRGIGRDTA